MKKLKAMLQSKGKATAELDASKNPMQYIKDNKNPSIGGLKGVAFKDGGEIKDMDEVSPDPDDLTEALRQLAAEGKLKSQRIEPEAPSKILRSPGSDKMRDYDLDQYADGGVVSPTDTLPDDGSSEPEPASPSPAAVPTQGNAGDDRAAKIAAINKMADLSDLKQNPTVQNMLEGISMGTTAPVEAGLQKAMSPELMTKLQELLKNPSQMLQTQGPMDAIKFQKLRDALGLTGPILPR